MITEKQKQINEFIAIFEKRMGYKPDENMIPKLFQAFKRGKLFQYKYNKLNTQMGRKAIKHNKQIQIVNKENEV